MTGEPIHLSTHFVLYGEQDFPRCLEAVPRETQDALHSAELVYAATILGAMDEEQAALAQSPVPLELQSGFSAALRNAAGVPVIQVSAACVSGAAALVLARARLVSGRNRCVGIMAFEQVSNFLSGGFAALRCLTDSPAPYTRGRQGFRLASGFGWAMLSSHPEDAQGIRLAGAASSSDAAHLTGPDREGRGLLQSIRAALQQARLEPDAIDALKLNGAGTGYSDAAEYAALQTCFGKRLKELPCLCLKPSIGHMQGASGLVETIAAADCLRRQCLPGVPDRMRQDVEFPVNVSGEDREVPMKRMLLVFSGMGGQNAALILEREPQ